MIIWTKKYCIKIRAKNIVDRHIRTNAKAEASDG